MLTCYLCDQELTLKNTSKEHIFLNSIGGHLKSNKLLCQVCNSIFGYKADTELANQLSFFANFLEVKRDRGKNQIIKGGSTKDGKEYYLVNGINPVLKKPSIKRIVENGESKFAITARNEKELAQIIKELKNKYPTLNTENALQNAKTSEYYLSESLNYNISIGGELANRSIVKSAVNYYIHTQHDKTQIAHLFEYLKGNEELKIAKHFYPSTEIYRKEEEEIIHLIHLVGDSRNKLLYCFIEFFSSYSFSVNLSNNYTGKDFSSTYSYDILKNATINKDVKLELTIEELSETHTMSKEDFTRITNKLERVWRIADKIKIKKGINEIINNSVIKICGEYKDELVLTDEMLDEIIEDISVRFTKFMFRGEDRERGGGTFSSADLKRLLIQNL